MSKLDVTLNNKFGYYTEKDPKKAAYMKPKDKGPSIQFLGSGLGKREEYSVMAKASKNKDESIFVQKNHNTGSSATYKHNSQTGETDVYYQAKPGEPGITRHFGKDGKVKSSMSDAG